MTIIGFSVKTNAFQNIKSREMYQ